MRPFSQYLQLLRVESWIGMYFVFAIGTVAFKLPSLTAFVSFSISLILAVCGIFIVNQYFDREIDKNNIRKTNFFSFRNISSTKVFVINFSLFFLSILIIFFVNVIALPVFSVGILMGLLYSIPPFRLKCVPIADFIIAGIGSGVIPFIIGLQASNQLTFDLSFPFMQRNYQDAFFCCVPLLIFFSATHLLQCIGDYETDKKSKIETFVVKYGKRKSVKIVLLSFLISAILPILYFLFDLFLTNVFYWYLILLLCLSPIFFYIIKQIIKNPENNINYLRPLFLKFGSIILLLIWGIAFFTRTITP